MKSWLEVTSSFHWCCALLHLCSLEFGWCISLADSLFITQWDAYLRGTLQNVIPTWHPQIQCYYFLFWRQTTVSGGIQQYNNLYRAFEVILSWRLHAYIRPIAKSLFAWVWVKGKKTEEGGGQRVNKDFVRSASSLRSFPYQGHMSAVEENGEGRRGVQCDGPSLARHGPQAEQLKHQPVGTPRRELRAGWHTDKRESQVWLQWPRTSGSNMRKHSYCTHTPVMQHHTCLHQ